MFRLPALIVAAAVAAAILMAPGVASAHARLKSSTPAVGEVLQTSPAQVSITFTQEIQKVAGTYDIQVTKDRGPGVTSGPAAIDEADRAIMSVTLQPSLPAGRYVVTFKNVSDADGDPFTCSYSFYVQTPPTAVDQANDQQLAAGCEGEGTPAPGETPAASAPAGGGTVTAPETPAAVTPVATADAPSSSSGGSNTGRNVIIAISIAIVAVIAVGGGGWFAMNRRG
jgi:copper resistance protein C